MRGYTVRLLGSVIVVVVALLSACAENKGKALASQFTELMGRPDIEAAAQRYEEMQTKITETLTAESIASDWRQDEGSSSVRGCLPAFPEVDSAANEVRALKMWSSPGNLADEKWDRAVALVNEVARGYGFGDVRVVVNRPSDHEVSIRDGYGAEILFGTAKNTILGVTTGCHLTVEAHQRGVPTGGTPR
jgi:predicted LppA-like lipoprotein